VRLYAYYLQINIVAVISLAPRPGENQRWVNDLLAKSEL